MKSLFFYAAIFCGLLASCQNSATDEDQNDAKDGKKNVSKRDYSITEANAYSSLFLDSIAVEKYIADKKLHDSVSRRIRSFYSTRNYQFAWFSNHGLT
jgi:hypothetical protein